MLRYAMVAAGLALGLSACAPMGVDSKQALKEEFEAPVSYREAYQRAHDQAEMCLRGDSGHQVEGSIDESGSAQVYVRAPFTSSRLASVDIKAIDAGRSQVNVTMWGVNAWDRHAASAMRDAILVGVPTCRSYMPAAAGGRKR